MTANTETTIGVQRSQARTGSNGATPKTANAALDEFPGNEVPPHDGADPLLDLPPPDTKRWIVRHKASVVTAVRAGALTREEACRRYALSLEEFDAWERAFAAHGTPGLRVTRLQIYRDIPRIRPATPRRRPAGGIGSVQSCQGKVNGCPARSLYTASADEGGDA